MNFNVHHHEGKEVVFPARQDKQGRVAFDVALTLTP